MKINSLLFIWKMLEVVNEYVAHTVTNTMVCGVWCIEEA